MATTRGSIAVPRFPSSSYSSCKPKSTCTLSMMVSSKLVSSHWSIACSAVQESSAPTGNFCFLTNHPISTANTEEAESAKEAAPVKPKPPAKAPAKPLPKMMGEDVIPSLKAILESQDGISQMDLSFGDNRLEGSLLKKGVTYSFWAFFPNGVLTGPKGFSLSSYGSEVSTVDETRITAKHVVFWVEKRLAAQGIIPVWKQ